MFASITDKHTPDAGTDIHPPGAGAPYGDPMSDKSEGWGSDFGETELDPQERKDADTYLEDPEAGDDEPWSPPQRRPRAAEFDDTEDDTLDQRVDQEEPEEGTAYGAPDNEGRLRRGAMVGGDDPDAIPADQDFVGDPAEVDEESTYRRRNKHASPEESALHIVKDDEQSPEEEDIDLVDEDIEYED